MNSCEADIIVPALSSDGELRGLLLVKSDREGSLFGYRSGELLSLSLLGHFLGSYLPGRDQADDTVVPSVLDVPAREPDLLTV